MWKLLTVIRRWYASSPSVWFLSPEIRFCACFRAFENFLQQIFSEKCFMCDNNPFCRTSEEQGRIKVAMIIEYVCWLCDRQVWSDKDSNSFVFSKLIMTSMYLNIAERSDSDWLMFNRSITYYVASNDSRSEFFSSISQKGMWAKRKGKRSVFLGICYRWQSLSSAGNHEWVFFFSQNNRSQLSIRCLGRFKRLRDPMC